MKLCVEKSTQESDHHNTIVSHINCVSEGVPDIAMDISYVTLRHNSCSFSVSRKKIIVTAPEGNLCGEIVKLLSESIFVGFKSKVSETKELGDTILHVP